MAIWIAQFVGREIRLLDYIEGVGQPLGYYANELRRRGWKDVIIYLPHDGVATNNISGKRYIDHWIEAGFECGPPIKNSGAGAAMMRVEAARRVFPRCWFNESTTEAGRDALGYYTNVRTRSAVSDSAPNMTGPQIVPTVLGIWRFLMKSRRSNLQLLGDHLRRASAAIGRLDFTRSHPATHEVVNGRQSAHDAGPPHVLEADGAQFGIAGCVLDGPVPEPILDQPRVMARRQSRLEGHFSRVRTCEQGQWRHDDGSAGGTLPSRAPAYVTSAPLSTR
jgi:hypothetical protein